MTPAEHYELLGELASGGMATVYIGRRRRKKGADLVAIKSMRQELVEDEDFATMFLDEAVLTARIKHPNVVQTLDVANEGGKLLIVMEYVAGVSLGRLIELATEARSSLPPRVVVSIIGDLLRGLHAAHELVDSSGRPLFVVHRDVSPQNVIVGHDGVARILDFGVAKASTQRHVTLRGEIKGKLAYMPPEQALGEMVDRRTDVYAAGVVLWEALVGRRLFSARSEEELVAQIFNAQIDPPSLVADEEIPSAVDQVVLRALAQERDSRWETAALMADALATALNPARHEDVARLVRSLARGDLEERAAHIRQLEANAGALDSETQTLQTILTGRAARSASAGKEVALTKSPRSEAPRSQAPAPRSHAPRPSSAPVVPAGSTSEERRARREARRKRRRTQVMLGFGAAVTVILLLMILALIAGRHAQ